MEKQPIYRKFKNGKEFMKLSSNGMLIKVYLLRENDFTLTHTKNQFMIQDFHNTEISMESNRDEFEKAYGQAWFQLSKTNCEQ